MNYKLLFKYAMLTGEIMLKNGAETYRVEDTIIRILKTSQFMVTEAFVTLTGLFATLDDPTIDMITYVKRVNERTIHMNKVSQANDISRKFCAGTLPLEQAYQQLLIVQNMPAYPKPIRLLATCLTAGFFTLVFGGRVNDFITATIIGLALGLLQIGLNKIHATRFFIDLIGGALIAACAFILTQYIPIGMDMNVIIIGSIMPLVPGVAITNAVRDTIQGDLVSGLSRAVEAFMIASAIAIGVGSVLKIFYLVYGGSFS